MRRRIGESDRIAGPHRERRADDKRGAWHKRPERDSRDSPGQHVDPDGNGERKPWAEQDHDHSGKFGSTAYLREEGSVDRFHVTDLVTWESPMVDVRAYGMLGDDETDDSEVLPEAADAATPHEILYVPLDLVVRFGSLIDVDLSIEGESVDETANRFLLFVTARSSPPTGWREPSANGPFRSDFP